MPREFSASVQRGDRDPGPVGEMTNAIGAWIADLIAVNSEAVASILILTVCAVVFGIGWGYRDRMTRWWSTSVRAAGLLMGLLVVARAGQPTRLVGGRRQRRHRVARRPSQPGRQRDSPDGDQCFRTGRNCLCCSVRRGSGSGEVPLLPQRAHHHRRRRRRLGVVRGDEAAAGTRSTPRRNSSNAGNGLLVSLGSRHGHRGVVRHVGRGRGDAPERCRKQVACMRRGRRRRCGRD